MSVDSTVVSTLILKILSVLCFGTVFIERLDMKITGHKNPSNDRITEF
jgi:hypothetical protein